MRRYAIIIGCDEYKEYDNIVFCNDDAFEVQDTLIEFCDYEPNNIELIFLFERDKDSEVEGLLLQISKFIERIEEDDTLLFYFAGHGIVVENEAYLVLPETRIGEEKTTALAMSRLNSLFKEKKINNFRIIDACHSGLDNTGSRSLDFVNLIKSQSWATLASCSAKENSYPDYSFKHGIFTYYITETIKETCENEEISIEMLKQEVCKKMNMWCEKNYKRQTPTLTGCITGNISIAIRNSKPAINTLCTDNKVINNEVENKSEKVIKVNELMSTDSKEQGINLWNSPQGMCLPRKIDTVEMLKMGNQLRKVDIKSIWILCESEMYEGASELIFNKGIGVLRKRVLSLGTEFVGEMVGIDNIEFIKALPPYEVINVASELGFIDKTGKVRLMNANELVNHFGNDETYDEMSEEELKSVIRPCIQYILAQDDSNLTLEFVNFRERLKNEYIESNSDVLDMLVNSPYFYKKTTIRTLINLLEQTKGAEFETVVSNLVRIVRTVWEYLTPDERYFIGMRYSKYCNEGEEKYIKPLKTALVGVHGFDYVPENLRSLTFIKQAKNIKSIHYAMNNFYNEPSAVRKLEKLGNRIPKPAINECVTAILMVKLGNSYNVSFDASQPCYEVLNKLSIEDWKYYLEYCLKTSEDVLYKLRGTDENVKEWIKIVERYNLSNIDISNKNIRELLILSKDNKIRDIKSKSSKILEKLNLK
ncbi:MAG: caspase family protein [Romboutsia sp.]